MAEKLDYKKEYKILYMPPQTPVLVDVPEMHFIMIDGKGAPGGKAYQDALSALYALTFTIKMSKMGGKQPDGYFEYVVPPLEGLWWGEHGKLDIQKERRDSWCWTSMIRQPEFVTENVFRWAVAECIAKKPDIDVSGARFENYAEGKCVQIMHIGPYSQEAASMEKMHAFAKENGFAEDDARKHHEIYLSDPRRTDREKLKTVLRLPVK
ncbi:MAG: GyrI-like domain-containing protein [Christensenellaceae bacterium]|jgi:hypothetical protein